MILLLLACTRDPSLIGYWDIVLWTVGTGDSAAEAADVGTVEFTAASSAWLVMSYRYDNGEGIVPDRTPNAEEAPYSITHTNEDEDQLLPSYKSPDERYFLELFGRYEVLEYTGSGMILSAKGAAPYGTWDDLALNELGNYVPTSSLPVEMELFR